MALFKKKDKKKIEAEMLLKKGNVEVFNIKKDGKPAIVGVLTKDTGAMEVSGGLELSQVGVGARGEYQNASSGKWTMFYDKDVLGGLKPLDREQFDNAFAQASGTHVSPSTTYNEVPNLEVKKIIRNAVTCSWCNGHGKVPCIANFCVEGYWSPKVGSYTFRNDLDKRNGNYVLKFTNFRIQNSGYSGNGAIRIKIRDRYTGKIVGEWSKKQYFKGLGGTDIGDICIKLKDTFSSKGDTRDPIKEDFFVHINVNDIEKSKICEVCEGEGYQSCAECNGKGIVEDPYQ